jgi:hypothetical protein
MTSIKTEIDQRLFTLVEPNLHDGWLLGINIRGKDSIELSAKGYSGVSYSIYLKGVSHFRADDFRAGNIIFDVTIIPANAVRIDHLDQLAEGGATSQQTADHLRRIQEKVQRESLLVLLLSSSYGCQLLGICKEVAFASPD